MTETQHGRRRLRLGPADTAAVGLAVFALAWAVVRAQVQAVTGDEGMTFEIFVLRRDAVFQWAPAHNNHLLNTMLMRLFTSAFGVWHLTVRAPALIGAALYIGVSLWLAKLIGREWYVRLALFVCLVYNPFVFDFLVAARGYGMAVAFLTCAVAGPAWYYLSPGAGSASRLIRVCALSSGLLALSFTASFPFAFAVAAGWLALLLWAPCIAGRLRVKAAAACLLPGLAVLLLLPSHTLLHWRGGESYDGVTSLVRTVETVAQASLYELNPYILNPLLLPAVAKLKRFLIPGMAGLVLLCSLLIIHERTKLRERDRRLFGLGVAAGGVAVLSLLLHLAAFIWFGLPLPQNRAALFLVPLCTLAAGMIAAVPLPSRAGRLCRGTLLGTFCLLAFYQLMCLRLNYFREWQYQQDVRKIYDVVAWYNHNRGVRDVEVGWAYHGALSFYRDMSGRETLLPFTHHDVRARDKDLYVLDGFEDRAFIAENHLKAVYRGETTDVVVAVRPEFAEPPKTPPNP